MDLASFLFGAAASTVTILSIFALVKKCRGGRAPPLQADQIKPKLDPVCLCDVRKCEQRQEWMHDQEINTITDRDHQILLAIMPELVWEQVLLYLRAQFQALESCCSASDYLDNLIENSGHLSILSSKEIVKHCRVIIRKRIDCFPKSLMVCLFPELILPKLQITTMNICVNINSEPFMSYLKQLIGSQFESLETLHISCLGLGSMTWNLPGKMVKLRDLKIERNVRVTLKDDAEFYSENNRHEILRSLKFYYPRLPALESLTLSAFGLHEDWSDFFRKPFYPTDFPGGDLVKRLRILPGRPNHVTNTCFSISEKIVFPNLVSLEIPAILLECIRKLFPAPENLKRLTLTLPTRGLYKHLFDVSITGYSEQVCAAILANPDRDPQEIREEIEQENFDEWDSSRITTGNILQGTGDRVTNLTNFTGLEELGIKSDTGNWGPTQVSFPYLLSMRSLKTLRFWGHKPKYIPDDVLRKMKERFTVLFG